MTIVKVSIVGTAGRARIIDRLLFEKMVRHAEQAIKPLSEVELISGGAAYADHIAVCIHKMHALPLHLHLPTHWDEQRKRFHDNGGPSWRINPGRLANFYHHRFATTLGASKDHSLNSLHDLITNKKIKTTVHAGFHARNIPVSQVDILIAYTWGTSSPPPGGTKHTWQLAQSFGAKCQHVNLATL